MDASAVLSFVADDLVQHKLINEIPTAFYRHGRQGKYIFVCFGKGLVPDKREGFWLFKNAHELSLSWATPFANPLITVELKLLFRDIVFQVQ